MKQYYKTYEEACEQAETRVKHNNTLEVCYDMDNYKCECGYSSGVTTRNVDTLEHDKHFVVCEFCVNNE